MNTCPKCGLIQGLHFSVLPGCKCQWQGTPNSEPVDYMYINWDASASLVMTPNPAFAKREWVGLTDDEIIEIRLKTFDAVATNYEVYRAIEAKLKEKNR